MVLVDNVTQKKFIGIGGPENYHGMKILNGTYSLPRFNQDRIVYNIKFCPKGSQNCLYIGSYDKGEGGRPLILPAEKALEAGNY